MVENFQKLQLIMFPWTATIPISIPQVTEFSLKGQRPGTHNPNWAAFPVLGGKDRQRNFWKFV
jgi:hypothetical protein